MNPQCTLKPHNIERNTGKVKPSLLFLDLKEHNLGKKEYIVLKNELFTENLDSETLLDSLGEPKFEVVAPIFNKSVDAAKQGIMDRLNKQLGKGVYTYKEAVNKIADFNASETRDGFMATIFPNKDKLEIKIVEDTAENRDLLQKVIEALELIKDITTQIEKVGGSVEFITKGDSRYDSTNAKDLADGVHTLVTVNSTKDIPERLAHEAGHVAVGALGKSPLIQRLYNLLKLSPEVVKSLTENSKLEDQKEVTRIREAMGQLVGEAILKRVDKLSPLGRVASKIISAIKLLFHTITGSKIKAIKDQAERLSSNIAYNFMTVQEGMSYDNIKETPEVLYDVKLSGESQAYLEAINALHSAIKLFKDMGAYSTAKELRKMDENIELHDLAGSRESLLATDELFAKGMSYSGVVSCLENLKEWFAPLGLINNLVKDIDISNDANFEVTRIGWANRIRQVSILFSTTHLIMSAILASMKDMDAGYKEDLERILSTLSSVIEPVVSDFNSKKLQFFLTSVEKTLGRTHIKTAAKLYRRKSEGNGIKKWWKKLRPPERIIAILDLLNEQQCDIGIMDTYIRSMSNNPEIIGQWADVMMKRKNAEANANTLKYFNRLMELRDSFRKLNLSDTSILFHHWDRTDDTLKTYSKGSGITEGKLSGYLLSTHDVALWERTWLNFIYNLKEKFKEEHPEYKTWSDTVCSAKFLEYSKEEVKEWRENNAEYDLATKLWKPNDNYLSAEYAKVMSENPGLRDWYEKGYIPLKKELDGKLSKGVTRLYRAPQFRGIFVNKVKNRNGSSGLFGATKKSIASLLSDTVFENCDDRDFGNDKTYNTDEPMGLFNNKAMELIEFDRRLPVYGVNLMSNMDNLSTDLFHTTLAYAHMANKYQVLRTVVDLMELGRLVLSNRTPKGGILNKELGKIPYNRTALRFSRYIDKELYSMQESTRTFDTKYGKASWNKMARTLSSAASKAYMGFNVLGGVANTGTGFIELHKEAAVGEFYNKKDALWADNWYFKHFAQNWALTGIKGKDDPISLFNRHFNIRNDNELDFREFKTMHSRAYNILNQSVMATYSTGDHYMQIVPFMSILHHTILYDESGNEVRASDVYEILENPKSGRKELYIKGTHEIWEDPNTGKKEIRMKQNPSVYFIGKDASKENDLIESIARKIKSIPTMLMTDMKSPLLNLTLEEKDFVEKLKLTTSAAATALQVFSEYRHNNLIWGTKAEADLKLKAQEVSIRLHGIYNNADKTAFQQTWYGRMLFTMRQWVLGMGERRFGGKHYSLALGKDVEGNIRTFAKVALDSLGRMFTKGEFKLGLFLTMLTIMPYGKLPNGKDVWERGKDFGLTENEIANLRRSAADNIAILLLGTLLPLLFSMWGKIDEDLRPVEALMYYWVNRWLYELEALSSFLGIQRESVNAFNLFPAGLSYAYDMADTLYHLAGTPFADKNDSEYFYKSKKKGYYKKGDSKAVRQLMRNLPIPWKSYEGLTHAETAWKSFNYTQSKFGSR